MFFFLLRIPDLCFTKSCEYCICKKIILPVNPTYIYEVCYYVYRNKNPFSHNRVEHNNIQSDFNRIFAWHILQRYFKKVFYNMIANHSTIFPKKLNFLLIFLFKKRSCFLSIMAKEAQLLGSISAEECVRLFWLTFISQKTWRKYYKVILLNMSNTYFANKVILSGLKNWVHNLFKRI